VGNIWITMVVMVTLAAFGAIFKRMQLLRQEHAAFLNSIVINLTLPATVFLAVRKVRDQPWQQLLKVPLIAYTVLAACGVTAYFLTRWLRLERRTAGAFIIIAMLGSTATLGYPLIGELYKLQPPATPSAETCQAHPGVCAAYEEILVQYGQAKPVRDYPPPSSEACSAQPTPQLCTDYQETLAQYAKELQEAQVRVRDSLGAAAFFSELGTLIPLLTVAVVIASRYGEGEKFTWRNLLAVLKFGPFVAFLIGLLFLNDPIPDVITSILSVLSQATLFLVMLSLGITIRWGDFFGRQRRAILAVNVIKLVLAPALTLLLCLLLGLGGTMGATTVLMAALPALVLCLAYANQYHLDVEFSSNALFASFLLGAVTLSIAALVTTGLFGG
jgi:predicted permease